jgi:hypothetical protein
VARPACELPLAPGAASFFIVYKPALLVVPFGRLALPDDCESLLAAVVVVVSLALSDSMAAAEGYFGPAFVDESRAVLFFDCSDGYF